MKLYSWILWLYLLPISVICSVLDGDPYNEYDKYIKILLGPGYEFKSAPLEIQAEIKTIHKCFNLEKEHRKKSIEFSQGHFYEMNQCSTDIFRNCRIPALSALISNDNQSKLMAKGIYGKVSYKFVTNIYNPHFPDISLQIFKSGIDKEKQAILVENAMSAPFLFEKFFKYLAREFYKVSRDNLHKSIALDYNNLSSKIFNNYQYLSRQVQLYLACERAILSVAFVWIPYHLQSESISVFILIPFLVSFFIVAFNYFEYWSHLDYSNFSEITPSQISRYFKFNHLLKYITFAIFEIDRVIYQIIRVLFPDLK